ncbi:putative pentatricopeptide repeat-containing protein At3g23330 isoform X1 [Selaginella moellendorffii]|nr:putative pentatricopeptide repeat-containing protein At3g23330 isoform X1 [Selaginella moellendorffii]XP_024527514.1 putative pentatricopeptide repeat-containing protein At3g23330 isoform X1 [Selaginella moellendorffii]|eukprot:XP_024527508.1 putative pentatricopeptide repeat-containing protein At3g23330 isoform X1 [Selaginella moellendorffii]
MYAKCKSMDEARKVFDAIDRPDVVSYTALISGYADSDQEEAALELFTRMVSKPGSCEPNHLTFVAALKACSNLATRNSDKMGSLEKGVVLHARAAATRNLRHIYVGNSLVDMYSKCGSMVDARKVFDRMEEHDVVSWTSLLLGYAENSDNRLAVELFGCMKARVHCPSPNARACVPALVACGNLADLEAGKIIHAGICRSGLEDDEFVAASLVGFYGKCGDMTDAHLNFDGLLEKPDLATWSSLITGYSRQGSSDRVLDLFGQMKDTGVKADGVIFLAILTACTHAGLVETGKSYFRAMVAEFGITPGIQHYCCMVDLLGRSNRLEEAWSLAKTMPMEADAAVWRALLSACQKWRNATIGRAAFESLAESKSEYVLMANIYAMQEM